MKINSEVGAPIKILMFKKLWDILIQLLKNNKIDLEEVYAAINKRKNLDFDNSVKKAIGGKKLPPLLPLAEAVKENGKNISHRQKEKKKVNQVERKVNAIYKTKG